MAIEFKCSNCGKELFAQEQYAGMRTTCPGCQTKMPIPFPAAANQTAVLAAIRPDANFTYDEGAAAGSSVVFPQGWELMQEFISWKN